LACSFFEIRAISSRVSLHSAITWANMPRWEGPPKFQYSPERLLAFREYNRLYRERLRGGKPPMPYPERGRLGSAIREAKRRKRKAAKGRS
jgi:hypothetical protein